MIYCMEITQNKVNRISKIFQLKRILILKEISQNDRCACELVEILNIPSNLLSHHLKVLSDIGLIIGRKKGLHVKYSLIKGRKKNIKEILNCIEKF